MHAGLSSVERLRTGEIDAIVCRNAAELLPPGFEPVAVLSQNAFIARRR